MRNPPEDREAALRRVLLWYLHAADAARTWINPQEAHIPLEPLSEGLTPASSADYEEAVRWYEAERGNLLAARRAAEEAGLDVIAWQLPAVLRGVHMILNPFEEWLTMSRLGLGAARRVGDRTAEAELLESLGMAYTQSHRLAEGAEHHQGALAARRERGTGVGRHGETYRLLGRPAEAADFHRRAAAAHRELDDLWHTALALDGLAAALREAGESEEEARRHWTEALRALAPYDGPRAAALRERITADLA